MATLTPLRSPLQHAAEMDKVLRIWAKALGCPMNQVTDVVRRAGLPIEEKFWYSIARGAGNSRR
jgi:hypothetical protein